MLVNKQSPAATFFGTIKTAPPLKESQHNATYITPFPPSTDLSDNLFFVQYTPETHYALTMVFDTGGYEI